jgi:hypothetical protein
MVQLVVILVVMAISFLVMDVLLTVQLNTVVILLLIIMAHNNVMMEIMPLAMDAPTVSLNAVMEN